MKHQSEPAAHLPKKMPKHIRESVAVGLASIAHTDVFLRDVSHAHVLITKRILGQVLEVDVATISDDVPIDALVGDSLIFEIVAMKFEDFLGQEIDRLELLGAKTVTSLASLLRQMSINRH